MNAMIANSNPGEVTYTRIYDVPRDLIFTCMISFDRFATYVGGLTKAAS